MTLTKNASNQLYLHIGIYFNLREKIKLSINGELIKLIFWLVTKIKMNLIPEQNIFPSLNV